MVELAAADGAALAAHAPAGTPAAESEIPYIRPLDGVRGLAALAVFFHHGFYTAIYPAQWPAAWQPLIALSDLGAYGVDIFFVLSGYLITSILITTRRSTRYFRIFYAKRVTRILPIYLAVLAFVLWFMPNSGAYVLLSALFLANFAQVLHLTAAGPFWTLAIEEQFYAVWPLLARVCTRRGLARAAPALLAVEPVLRFIAILKGHHDFVFTFFHADGLAFGALLACRPLGRDAGSAARNGLLALAAGAGLYALSAAPFGGLAAQALEALQLTAVALFGYGVIGLCVALPRAPAVRWLAAAPLAFLGQISYAFYLIHGYVLFGFDRLSGGLRDLDPGYLGARMAVALVVTIALCLLTRYAIEQPGMRLRRYLL